MTLHADCAGGCVDCCAFTPSTARVAVVLFLLEGRFCGEISSRSFTFFIVQKLFSASYLFTSWRLLALPGHLHMKMKMIWYKFLKVIAVVCKLHFVAFTSTLWTYLFCVILYQ